MGMTIEPAPAAALAVAAAGRTEVSQADWAEACRDSTRLNWMEAQAELVVHEWVEAKPGGASLFELRDMDGDVLGSGTTLRAAIDDAMGNLMGGVAR